MSSSSWLCFFCTDEHTHVFPLLLFFFVHERQHTVGSLAFCFMQLLQTISKSSSTFFFFSFFFSFMICHYVDVHGVFSRSEYGHSGCCWDFGLTEKQWIALVCVCVYCWWCMFQGRIVEVELLNQNKYICSFVQYCQVSLQKVVLVCISTSNVENVCFHITSQTEDFLGINFVPSER